MKTGKGFAPKAGKSVSRKGASPTYFFPRYNRMFGDAMNASVRYVRFKVSKPCAHCGHKRRLHWTMIVPFRAVDFPAHTCFTLDTKSGPLLAPLSPVCSRHLLAPDKAAMDQLGLGMRYFFNLTYDRALAEQKAANRPSPTKHTT